MKHSALLSNRAIIRLKGTSARDFLQGLITNDMRKLTPESPLFSAMLSAQGKFQHDFLLYETSDGILLDTEHAHKDALIQKLKLYRLRADVTIEDQSDQFTVMAHWGSELPHDTSLYRDPRHPELGYRQIIKTSTITLAAPSGTAYNKHRLTLGIPDGSLDATERTFILENGYDAIDGVSFDKGCYVGQEVTARMYYRDALKKCLFIVSSDHELPEHGTPIHNDTTVIGEMRSHEGTIGLALLRMADAVASPTLHAQDITINAKIISYMEPKIMRLVKQSAPSEAAGD